MLGDPSSTFTCLSEGILHLVGVDGTRVPLVTRSSHCLLSFRLSVAKGKEGMGGACPLPFPPAAMLWFGHQRLAGLAQLAHSSCEDMVTQVSSEATSHNELLRGLL